MILVKLRLEFGARKQFARQLDGTQVHSTGVSESGPPAVLRCRVSACPSQPRVRSARLTHELRLGLYAFTSSSASWGHAAKTCGTESTGAVHAVMLLPCATTKSRIESCLKKISFTGNPN